MTEAAAVLHVPARDIPVPPHLTPEARAALAAPRPTAGERPALDDPAGWRALVAAADAALLPRLAEAAARVDAAVAELDVDGVRVFEITPAGHDPADRRVYLDIHGGALIMCGGDVCRAIGLATAGTTRTRVWAVDYRMPPDHPYPASLDDCLTVYRALLRDHAPGELAVGGGSAGGNLSAALLLRARDEGHALPSAAVLNSPEVDLTESGDTFNTNLGVDAMGRLMQTNLLYANGHDLADPYLSPLFGDFSRGFPPTFLSTGTRDLFLSNTVRMHRALRNAGIEAELHVIEAAPHGGFMGAPEDGEIRMEMRRFLDAHWAA